MKRPLAKLVIQFLRPTRPIPFIYSLANRSRRWTSRKLRCCLSRDAACCNGCRNGTRKAACSKFSARIPIRAIFRLFFERYRLGLSAAGAAREIIFFIWLRMKSKNSASPRVHGLIRSAPYWLFQKAIQIISSKASGLSRLINTPSWWALSCVTVSRRRRSDILLQRSGHRTNGILRYVCDVNSSSDARVSSSIVVPDRGNENRSADFDRRQPGGKEFVLQFRDGYLNPRSCEGHAVQQPIQLRVSVLE